MPANTKQRPRKQHYAFAHLAMRALIEASPMHVLMALLDKQKGAQLLDEVWREVAAQCDGTDLVDSNGLTYEIHELSDKRPVILIIMPSVKIPREAYYCAAVVTPPRRRWFLFTRKASVRYFTLECGDTSQGDFDTVLAEWCGDSHLNYSDNPDVSKQAFLRAVVAILQRKSRPLGATDHPSRLE